MRDRDQQPVMVVRDRNALKGTIKSLKKAEGYGFVTHSATGTDYFFHRSQVQGVPFDTLELDQAVEFTPSEGPKGARATAVRVL